MNIKQHTPPTQLTGGPRTPGIFPALSGRRRVCRRMIKSKFQIHNSPDGIYKVGIPQRPPSNRQTPWRNGSPHGRPTATPDVHSKQVQTRVPESSNSPLLSLHITMVAAVGRRPWAGRGSLDVSRRIAKEDPGPVTTYLSREVSKVSVYGSILSAAQICHHFTNTKLAMYIPHLTTLAPEFLGLSNATYTCPYHRLSHKPPQYPLLQATVRFHTT